MSANGISTLSTKEARQKAKLDLASKKRQGYTLDITGAIVSGPDISQPFFRSNDFYDITALPTQYSGNNIIDNPNVGGLILGRPWTGTQTYTFTITAGSVDEGGTLPISVTVLPWVIDGTTLYWTIDDITTDSNTDFVSAEGSFTLTSGAGSFDILPVADHMTEGPETFTVSIRTGSTSGTVVATSDILTVNDTSIDEGPVTGDALLLEDGVDFYLESGTDLQLLLEA